MPESEHLARKIRHEREKILTEIQRVKVLSKSEEDEGGTG